MNYLGELTSVGNEFSPVSGYNFHADVDYNVIYKWKLPPEEPITYQKIKPEWINNQAGCETNPLGDDDNNGPGDGDTSDEYDDYTVKNDRKIHIEDTITTCGGGNAVWVVINEVTAATAGDVAEMLTDLGPWLSDESAEEFVENANMFIPAQIVSVLSASPDVFMNETVYQFAFGDNSPLSPVDQATLQSVLGTVTEKTKLLVELKSKSKQWTI